MKLTTSKLDYIILGMLSQAGISYLETNIRVYFKDLTKQQLLLILRLIELQNVKCKTNVNSHTCDEFTLKVS